MLASPFFLVGYNQFTDTIFIFFLSNYGNYDCEIILCDQNFIVEHSLKLIKF